MNTDNNSQIVSKCCPAYTTDLGVMLHSTIEEALDSSYICQLRGQIDLIFTSPPFPLNTKKSYGNFNGDEYLVWLRDLAPKLTDLLSERGSIVIEIGNSWEPGRPFMSTLPLEVLLEFKKAADLNLCQQFVAHNPARLPSPAQWVTIERTRVKDSYTNIWWMSRSNSPKADNRRVLNEYSSSMRKLLDRQDYNRGRRPSGHIVQGDTFLTDNGGAIPPNVLRYSNTRSQDPYRKYCKRVGLPIHPARMAPQIAEFFIEFLTAENDIVFDPFGGSNTTGAVAEQLGRRWITTEADVEYAYGSYGRFEAVP